MQESNLGSGNKTEATVSSDGPCTCVVLNRHEDESQREWMKRFMCMHHWMQTDYMIVKLLKSKNPSKR